MSLNQLSFTTGVANSVTITFSAGSYDFIGAATRFVTLSHDYARVIPPGLPDANAGDQIQTSYTAFPQTIVSTKRVKFFAPEAAALVAASAGSYS